MQKKKKSTKPMGPKPQYTRKEPKGPRIIAAKYNIFTIIVSDYNYLVVPDMDNFKKTYRNLDLLLIDDIQSLSDFELISFIVIEDAV